MRKTIDVTRTATQETGKEKHNRKGERERESKKGTRESRKRGNEKEFTFAFVARSLNSKSSKDWDSGMSNRGTPGLGKSLSYRN